MSAQVSDLADKEFDYVVVGGGTAGLVVAARLAEDPSISVAVLEAGGNNIGDPLLHIPAQFSKQFGNPKYDWFYQTTPQVHANGRQHYWPRGKTLGGSSAINFFAWIKPPARDIDAWEALGNPGWNWERFNEYSRKVERFHPPSEEDRISMKQNYIASSHGYNGPLPISFPPLIMDVEVPLHNTLVNAGIPVSKDPMNGDLLGTSMAILTVDPETNTRSYSATAYYLPNKDRPNFHVLCDAFVRRLIMGKVEDGDVVATGVEFEHDSQTFVVRARKEVIVSAGAINTPQILELSGIGNSSHLTGLGIDVLVDLPGVGENLQEHLFCSVAFELDPSRDWNSLEALSDPEYNAEQLRLHAEGKGLYRLGLGGFTFLPLSSLTATAEDAKVIINRQRKRIQEKISSEEIASNELARGLKKQYEIQLDELDNANACDCELICFPGLLDPNLPGPEPKKRYASLIGAINHPFSRGNTHINSIDPHTYPTIDPHYFEDPFDQEHFVEIMKYVRRLSTVEPFKDVVEKEVSSSCSCETDADMANYIKNSMGTTFHTIGTTSMLPRELGGVVSPQLKVYGTKNVRVVDVGIIPLHISAHTQAAAYTIGEIAADLIKGKL